MNKETLTSVWAVSVSLCVVPYKRLIVLERNMCRKSVSSNLMPTQIKNGQRGENNHISGRIDY